ncbi:ABC transporter permease [Spirillospora sp. NPDC029432]|uniref:ABC transporter permease n=1 Tax=Spirillospora sp. NPDC029432 TaxID=3154599 RepID=UPI00345308FB
MDALAAEWHKLRSVKSTAWTLAALAGSVLLCFLWSWFVARHWDGRPPGERASMRAAPAEQPLVLALPVCAAVLGALAITSEYATGMIRTSMATVPARPRLFAAKAVVVAGVVLPAGLASVTAAVTVGRAIVGGRAVPSFAEPVTGQVPHLLGLAVWAAVIALVGYGAGAVLRSTAGAITAVVVLLMVLPPLADLLPGPWDARAGSVLLTRLPDQIAAAPAAPGGAELLSPTGAVAVLLLYAAVALAAGAFSFVRRDS